MQLSIEALSIPRRCCKYKQDIKYQTYPDKQGCLNINYGQFDMLQKIIEI